ncbi:MAG: gliding motility-associated C-terminal domain-containing protein [Saprospiraceae bacterium]
MGRIIALFLIFICSIQFESYAQNLAITYQNPIDEDALVVCDSAVFEVTLTNSSAEMAENISLNIQFPQGVSYNIGSIANAVESDLTDLNTPVFSIIDLAANQSITISLFASANCSLIDAINNMQIFSNTIITNYENGSNSLITTPYNIETPLLVMANNGVLVHSGSQGDIVNRTFTITNTRLGALRSFSFQDSHQGGIEISTNLGTDTSTLANVISVLIDGDDFSTIGDGDELFELDESITIVEEILITSCGEPISGTLSNISATWGCNTVTCQSTTPIEGFVNIETPYLEPELTFTPDMSEIPNCFCTGDPIQNSLTITNTSDHLATNIEVQVMQLSVYAGIDPTSFSIDSSGFISSVENVIPDSLIPYEGACNIENAVYEIASLFIPALEAGQTITLSWNTYACALECNPNKNAPWKYSYEYYGPCPPIPKIEGEGDFEHTGPVIDSELLGAPSVPIPGGSQKTYEYSIISGELLNDAELLTIYFEFPCGLSLLPSNDLILDGQTPINIDTNITDTITYISATYSPPFSSDSIFMSFDLELICDDLCEEVICKDTVITSCLDLCETDAPVAVGVSVNSSLQIIEGCPDICNLNTCASQPFPVECALPLCEEYIPGYAEYTFSIFRTNYGLPDNDDNRIADANGVIDFDLVRRDRIMAGDTVQLNVNSVVNIDEPGYTFPAGQILVNIGASDISTSGLDLFLENGLLPIKQELIIYDNSSGQYYDCGLSMPLTINTLENNQSFNFQFDISPELISTTSCDLPIGFEYEDGDSILFQQQFKINHNLASTSGSSIPPIINFIVSPEVYLLDEIGIDSLDGEFSCGCERLTMQLSGYKYDIASGIHAIPDCDTSQFVGGTLFSFLLGEGNFFPYEHRSLGKLTNWQIELSDGFSIEESKLTFLELQEDISLWTEEPLSFSNNNITYQYDLLPYQLPDLDEGFSFLLQSRFLADCSTSGSFPMTVHARIEPAANLVFPNPIDTSFYKAAALRTLYPDLELDATFFSYTSYNDQAEWDFTLENMITNVASFDSGTAKNVWVRPFSASGLLNDFELTNGVTGSSYPQINGIFQIGTMDPAEIENLRLTATNSSCNEEPVEVFYGWNCDIYNNPITTPCFEDSKIFTVISPPAALEQTVESPIGSHFLCDTIDYHTITIFNANLGTAYQPTVEVQLPPGVFVLPGSSEISYPSNNAFTVIGDPIDTGTGTMLWNIALTQDSIGQNGLPGFISNPSHSFQIRFQLFTNCDFIAGSYPIFFADAEQVCGIPTNSLAEAGEPITLSGLPPPYNSSISAVSGTPTVNCEDSTSVSVNLIADANTINGDSIFITLPAGISYVPNSFSGNTNAVNQEPLLAMINNLQVLKWPLIPNIVAGDAIAFDIEIMGLSDLECGPRIMLLQTVGPASALCTADNSTCNILVETGSSILQLNIDRASFDLSDFKVTVTPSGTDETIDYSIFINNIGNDSEPPLIVDFYIDSDNSGDWSVGDFLVYSDISNNTITTDNSLILNGTFIMDSGQACDLIAVIDESKHCTCAGDEQPLTTTVNYLVPEETVLCSGESQNIGIPENPMATYQWSPSTGLSCTDCATTSIDLINSSNNTNTLTYTLTEDDGQDCVIAYKFTVVVQPTLEITADATQICLGDSLLLQTTNANFYLWDGPDILNPALAEQWISPTENAVYSVQLTDALGCNSTDSIMIQVADAPIAFAGNDTLFCESSTVQLEALYNAEYTYQWSPANLLSDSEVFNPTMNNNTPTTFTLTVTNPEGCQNTDQIDIDFGAAPTLNGPANATVCNGDSTLLSYGGALNYSWSPATGLSCTDCSETFASPTVSTTYFLTGSDAIGCSSTASIEVNVLGSEATSEVTGFCDGESVMIFGQNISTPGIYCDTMVSQFTGCDSIHCITVEENLSINTEDELIICEGESVTIDGVIYESAGTYCKTAQTVNGCDSMHCVTLEIRSNPVITILPEVTILLGDTVALGPFPSEYNYSWTPSEGLSCDDCFDPLATPLEDTEYIAVVTDSLGCNNEFTIQTRTEIPICLPPHIFIPNAFTPNGDNENDILRVYGNSMERLHLMVFNRWGEKVFETFDIDGFWDGTYNGKQLAPDVFGYYLEVDCVGGESFSDKGNITLLR